MSYLDRNGEESVWHRRAAAAAALLAAFVVISTVYVMFKNLHPVLYKDSWETLNLPEAYQACREGRPISGLLRVLWAQWEEHRILFPKLFYLADYLLADGTGYLLVFFNLLFQALLAALIVSALRRHSGLSGAGRLCLSAFAVAACFWLVQSGNLLWGLQVSWFLSGLAAACGAFLVAGLTEGDSKAVKWGRMSAAAVCAVVASYSLANGVLVWFVLLPVLWKAGARGRILLPWLALAILTAAAHFADYHAPPHQFQVTDLFKVRNLHYLLVYLGNPLSRLNVTFGAVVGLIGTGLFAFFAGRFFAAPKPGFFSKFAFAQTAYVFMTAVVTAVGRSQFGIGQAASSRYYPPVIVFWFMLLALTCTALLSFPSRPPLPSRAPRPGPVRVFLAGAFCAFTLLLVAGQLASVPERKIRYVQADHAALALAAGVRDSAVLYYINHHSEEGARIWEQDAFVREHRLSIYREAWALMRGADLEREYAIDSRDPLRGRISEIGIRGEGFKVGRFVQGTIEPVPGEPMPQVILMTEKGRIVGFARTYGRSCAGCFSGYASGTGDSSFALFGLEAKSSRTVRAIVPLR